MGAGPMPTISTIRIPASGPPVVVASTKVGHRRVRSAIRRHVRSEAVDQNRKAPFSKKKLPEILFLLSISGSQRSSSRVVTSSLGRM